DECAHAAAIRDVAAGSLGGGSQSRGISAARPSGSPRTARETFPIARDPAAQEVAPRWHAPSSIAGPRKAHTPPREQRGDAGRYTVRAPFWELAANGPPL